jgi:hypothetical protein
MSERLFARDLHSGAASPSPPSPRLVIPASQGDNGNSSSRNAQSQPRSERGRQTLAPISEQTVFWLPRPPSLPLTTTKFIIAVTTKTVCQLPIDVLVMLETGMRKAEVPFAMLEQTEIYRRELEAALSYPRLAISAKSWSCNTIVNCTSRRAGRRRRRSRTARTRSAAVIAIAVSPVSVGTIIHRYPLAIPEWGRQQDASRCRQASDPLWPSRKLHRPFSFSSHHQQA